MYTYCGNNPIMNVDSDGHFCIAGLIGIIIGCAAIAATVNDIYQIVSGHVYANAPTDEVIINNSYKILTPWMRFGYSFYLNHINSETRDIIAGSTLGVSFEWMLHNLAYIWYSVKGDNEKITQAQTVNIGKTIFADKGHGWEGNAMKLLYLIIAYPISIIDLIINGGWTNEKEE